MTTIDHAALAQLLDMGISREDAIACLKHCNNNPNTAAEYFWNGDLEKARESTRWDESAWDAPREGDATNTSDTRVYPPIDYIPNNFKIHGQDVLSPNIFEGTKSRPPSRISVRPTDGNDDPDLAKAVAASMQSVSRTSEYGPQESGITGTRTSPTNPNFGPAQENKHYDPSQWAVATTQAQEVILEPPPADRKRPAEVPPFLRPSPNRGTVASAITILHSIPLARFSFLAPDQAQPNYGYHEKWWNGEKIEVPRVIDLDSMQFGLDDSTNFVMEMQRLMAFLDNTDRSYGSVDALLSQLQFDNSISPILDFFMTWSRSVGHLYGDESHPAGASLQSAAHELLPTGELHQQKHFSVLEVNSSEDDKSIYAAIDRLLWASEDIDVYVDWADIVAIQISAESSTSGQGIGIEMPMELYLDRYSKDYLPFARNLRKVIGEREMEIAELETRERRLKEYQRKDNLFARTGMIYSPKILLETTVNHFSTPMENIPNGDGLDDLAMETQQQTPDPTPLLKELLKKLEGKLSSLSELQKEAREALEKLRNENTLPESTTPGSAPIRRHRLRGFVPDPETTYLLLPPSNAEAAEKTEQWWCFSWGKKTITTGWEDQTYASFEAEKVPEEQALTAARYTDLLLLIYATDKAMEPIDAPLPERLKVFVDTDNAAFAAELEPTHGERKRRHSGWLDDELDESALPMGSPKRSSTRSSATLGTPRSSPKNGVAWGDSDTGNIVTQTLEYKPAQEMRERGGHVSPVAQAFVIGKVPNIIGRVPDSDIDMPDIEHVEDAERKGG